MRKGTVLLFTFVWFATVGAFVDCSTTNENSNQNPNNDGGAGITGGSELCSPVGSVRISAIPGSLSIGESERIDATPRDVFNQTRSVSCDESSDHSWASEDTDKCTIKVPSQYTTEVVAIDDGTCTVTITVDGKKASASFPVN